MTATVAPPILPTEAGDSNRLVLVTVNLLPEEVLAARAGRSARRFAIVIMALVLALVGVWYQYGRQSAADAAGQLTSQNSDVAAQSRKVSEYNVLTTTKSDIAARRALVAAATKGGIAWNQVITRVRGALPSHVSLTGITATTTATPAAATSSAATSAATSTTTPPPPSTTGGPASTATATDSVLGTLILTGIANSKNDVAAFSNQLATVKGVSDPIVTSVQRADKGNDVTFSLQVNVTTKSLSTRYDSKAGK